jgi:hypothetical protein
VPVSELDRQPEPGQGGDPAQAAQPVHDLGVVGVLGHDGDGLIKSVSPLQREQHRLIGGIEGQLSAG